MIEAMLSSINPILVVAALAGIAFGYVAGLIRAPRPRAAGLGIACLLPLILSSGLMAIAPSGPHGWFGWWVAGLIVLFVPMLLWLLMVAIGYYLARRRPAATRD
jgi:hypothetical protein